MWPLSSLDYGHNKYWPKAWHTENIIWFHLLHRCFVIYLCLNINKNSECLINKALYHRYWRTKCLINSALYHRYWRTKDDEGDSLSQGDAKHTQALLLALQKVTEQHLRGVKKGGQRGGAFLLNRQLQILQYLPIQYYYKYYNTYALLTNITILIQNY